MFVGRENELKKLDKLYKSGQFEFSVIYGRRRVGKTSLINQFIDHKEAVYYMAVEAVGKENLAGLSKTIFHNEINQSAAPEFSDYEQLFQYIDLLARNNSRLILVIDEYPYLAASYPPISSIIQKHIDECWKDTNLFLILCGSSMSFMEEQVLGYKSPLYGRRTAQFKIRPFSFFESAKMLVGFDREEQALLYGVTSGVPEYLSRINRNEDMDTNIISLFFDESGRLFDEPSNLLKQELREPATYHSIISAIAAGASRINEIATKTGLETSAVSNQITSLIKLGLVIKEVPVTEEKNSRKTIYLLADSMFRFWYRFVRPNASAIMRGTGEVIYQSIKPQLNDFMGKVFEQICIDYLYLPQVYSDLPFPIGNIGRWWGNNPKRKRQEEIDIISISENKILLGECKWTNAPIDVDVLDTLVERSDLFPYGECFLYFFSKHGFTKRLEDYVCDNERVKLIGFTEMVNTI